MPYIKKKRREELCCLTTDIYNVENAGELNYVITEVIKCYLEKHKKSYATINSIVGVLECAKQELYRRIAAPYEDEKIKENGDVY
jgi:broad-specificity NMP kinase